jgi:hypothetical protein
VRGLLGSKGIDKLLQEQRHAMIYCFRNFCTLEPFGAFVPTTLDYQLPVRREELV